MQSLVWSVQPGGWSVFSVIALNSPPFISFVNLSSIDSFHSDFRAQSFLICGTAQKLLQGGGGGGGVGSEGGTLIWVKPKWEDCPFLANIQRKIVCVQNTKYINNKYNTKLNNAYYALYIHIYIYIYIYWIFFILRGWWPNSIGGAQICPA